MNTPAKYIKMYSLAGMLLNHILQIEL